MIGARSMMLCISGLPCDVSPRGKQAGKLMEKSHIERSQEKEALAAGISPSDVQQKGKEKRKRVMLFGRLMWC
jgi:hypothetical protein